MNRLKLGRRTQVVAALVEGNSIRSTERMLGIHRDTIMRLLVEVGSGCADLMDEKMRELPCRRVQVDEIWSYVGKKQRHVKPGDNTARVGTRGRSLPSTLKPSSSRPAASASGHGPMPASS